MNLFKNTKLRLLLKIIEPLTVAVIIFSLAVVNLWHVIYSYLNRPPNTIFIGITHYYLDYFYYLNQITQGSQGNWLIRNLYTSENIPASPLWWPNILLGKISSITGFEVFTVYYLSVFIISLISLFLLYYTSRLLYPDKLHFRISTFLLAVMTSCYYLIQKNADGRWFINPYQYFYNYTESLNRLGGVFHLILQNILSLGIILTASKIFDLVRQPSKIFIKYALISAGLLFILCFINPVYVLIDGLAIFLYALIWSLFNLKNTGALFKLIIAGLLMSVPLLVPLRLMFNVFSTPFYSYFRWWELQIRPANPYIFLHSMGPIALLFLLGLVMFLKKPSSLKTLGIIWAVLPVLLYFSPLPNRLLIPYFRLHQPPSYIFIAAAAVWSFWLISKIFSKINSRFLFPVFYFLIIIYLTFQIPMILTEINTRKNNLALDSWLNYLDYDTYRGLKWLSKQNKNEIVLAINNLEVITPAISGHTVYTAHHSLTFDYNRKIGEAVSFFIGRMASSAAYEFLKQNNIGYVLWHKTDGPLNRVVADYDFLTKIFENSSLIIFSSK